MSAGEEYEHVPWSELAVEPSPDRRRLAYLVAAALVAAALGLVAVRTLWPDAPAGVTVAGPAPPPTTVVTATAPVDTAAVAQGGEPALYSEADLLAGATADDAPLAIMKAEWFVTDYFTADRDARGSLDLRTALPGDAALPDLPHDGPADVVSYVEWARAYRVDDLGEGLQRVAVAYRAVAGVDGEPLARLPVRAVEVVVRTAGDGVAIVDLPAPARLPLDVGFASWPDAGAAPPPPAVESAALQDAEAWGADPVIVSSSAAPAGWRVVVAVSDDAGAVWPLALWYDDVGPVAAPPWPDG